MKICNKVAQVFAALTCATKSEALFSARVALSSASAWSSSCAVKQLDRWAQRGKSWECILNDLRVRSLSRNTPHSRDPY